jgi:hypothetical protein
VLKIPEISTEKGMVTNGPIGTYDGLTKVEAQRLKGILLEAVKNSKAKIHTSGKTGQK